MKNLYFAIILLLSPFFVFSQHLYEIDLNKIEKDVLPVKMTLSKAPQKDQVIYSFPATVPGTYDTQDFGRFVLSMNAKTADGKNLKVKKQGNNSFIISDAKKLKYLEYKIIAQTTPLQKMDDFIQQKGDDFEAAYEKKDVKAYNALLSDYLLIYEKLSVDEKKQQSYLMSNIYYNLSCIYSISKDKNLL